MATYYFRDTGSTSFNTATNWSTSSGGAGDGAVPGASDTAIFDNNSGNCSVDVASKTITALTFTSYPNTLTPTNDLTVSGTLSVTAGADNKIGTGNILLNGSLAPSGISIISGSGTIILGGTGTWSGGGEVRNNLTINTAGTITISGSVTYNTGVLTYTAGTVTTTGSTLVIQNASTTLDTNGITWNNISGGGGATITNNSALTLSGSLTNSGGFLVINGSNVNISGSLAVSANGITGTALITLNGTGTWSGPGGVFNNLTINTAGTITVSGTVGYGTGTLTYTAGTVTTTSSTLSISGSCTLNTTGITWNNVSITTSVTVTLTSALALAGNLAGISGTATLNGAFTITVAGSLSWFQMTGTASILLSGTGTMSGAGTLQNSLTINTAGTITLSGNVNYGTGTWTYVAGTVNAGTSTVQITINSGTLNLPGVKLNNFAFTSSGTTLTLSAPLIVSGNLSSLVTGGSTVNGHSISVSGNLVMTELLTGTTEVVLVGSGTWSGTASIRNSFTVRTNGKYTIGGTVAKDQGAFIYERGVIDARSATLNLGTASNLTFTNVHKITWGGGVLFTSGSATFDTFFSGLGNIPCQIRPAAAGILSITITKPSVSKFISVQNVQMASTSPYRLQISTINANKGGNDGIIFMCNQLPQGFVDEEWVEANYGEVGFQNNWGQSPQGFVRNS